MPSPHKKMPITFRSTHVPWSKHHGLLGFIGYGHPSHHGNPYISLQCVHMHETNGQHGLCGIPSIWDDQPKWPKMQKPAGHMQRRSGAMSLGCLRHGKITWDISRVGLKRLGHLAGAKIQPEMAIGYISDSFKWTDNGWLVVVDHQDHSKKTNQYP